MQARTAKGVAAIMSRRGWNAEAYRRDGWPIGAYAVQAIRPVPWVEHGKTHVAFMELRDANDAIKSGRFIEEEAQRNTRGD